MKLVIVVALALAAVAVAAPPEAVPQTLRSNFDQQPEGGYAFGFETENGISRSENGEVKTVNDEENKPHSVVVVRGSYSYSDPEGKPVSVNYVADEAGYRAEGDSIPKPLRR